MAIKQFATRLKIWVRQRGIDPDSLQVRLAVGVTLVSVLGFVGVSGWMSWRTQQILIGSQKQQIVDLGERLPQDISTYQTMLSEQDALEKAVEVRSLPDVSIVVSDGSGQILAQSDSEWHDEAFLQSLTQRPSLSLQPDVFQAGDQFYVACEGPLEVDGERIGEMHLALNITESSLMFQQLMWSLAAATGFAIALITVAIALYVRRSVHPLRQISQMTAGLTVNDLDRIDLHLDNAPTEVQELAQTCETTLRRLADALTQQRQFVHDISHELRTPLTIVYGYVQSTLRRSQNLNEIQREALDSAKSEAERTIRLLQHLLELARADSDRLEFRQEDIQLNMFVQDLFKVMRPLSNHNFYLEAADSNIFAVADGDRLKQVMVNLLENAVRYSDPNQAITVRLDQTGNSAIIQVCDRGQGIPPEHQARIFDRCYRVDEARARSTGGCGLGLSIVKSLVEGMDGTIHLQSAPNEGSIFTVTLPAPPSDYDRKHRDRRGRRKISSLH